MWEEPYPDMTDCAVLERLLSLALHFTDTEPYRAAGDALYRIHGYLENRLQERREEDGGSSSLAEAMGNAVGAGRGESDEQEQPGPEPGTTWRGQNVNVFINCRVDGITITTNEREG